MTIPSNIERIKPYFVIEVQLKGEYKTYLSQSLSANPSYIYFHGVELRDNKIIDTYENVTSLLNSLEQVDKYFAWSSVVEITSKRLVKPEK